MEFHEAANIFPIDEENLSDLAKDIRTNGQQVPIERHDGKIIDGRRRFKACRMVGVTPKFRDVQIPDPVAYVLSLNLHRRHLSSTQLSMCAARAAALSDKLRDEAKERQRLSKGRGQKGPENLPDLKGDSRDQLGKAFGVSGKSVDHAAKVLTKGTPELIKAVDDDLIAVSTAAKATTLSEEEQEGIVKRASEKAANGRKPKPRPTEAASDDNEKPEGEMRGVGVVRAHEAINSLKRIPKNDALRKRGFQIVTDWIRHTLKDS